MTNKETVRQIYIKEFSSEPKIIKRLLTGICNYVYLVENNEGLKHIVRISSPDEKYNLYGSKFWLKELSMLDIPIAKLIREDIEHDSPYIILEYLPGNDLGNVYKSLSYEELENLAKEMVRIQKEVEKLESPYSNRYGYLISYDASNYHENWKGVIDDHINRSEAWMKETGVFDLKFADRVKEVVNTELTYIKQVKPTPFFHDATTKNVLIHNGKLAGIIDLDSMSFGDPLYQIALTHMSLLESEDHIYYIESWLKELKLSEKELRIFRIYTLIFCLDFMSGIGKQFNKDEPVEVKRSQVDHMKQLFESIIDKL